MSISSVIEAFKADQIITDADNFEAIAAWYRKHSTSKEHHLKERPRFARCSCGSSLTVIDDDPD